MALDWRRCFFPTWLVHRPSICSYLCQHGRWYCAIEHVVSNGSSLPDRWTFKQRLSRNCLPTTSLSTTAIQIQYRRQCYHSSYLDCPARCLSIFCKLFLLLSSSLLTSIVCGYHIRRRKRRTRSQFDQLLQLNFR
jgi:hypothetical protein